MRSNFNSMNARSGPPVISLGRRSLPLLVGLMLISGALTMVTSLPARAQGDGVAGGENDFLPRFKRGRKALRRISETQAAPAAGTLPGEGSGSGVGSGVTGGGGKGAGDADPGVAPGFGGPGPGFGGPGPGPGFGGGGPGPGFGGRLKHSGLGRAPLDLTSLNLTEEQKNRIKAQRAKSAPRARELQQVIKAKRMEMRDLMFDPSVTAKQLTEKRQELRAAQDEAETLMLNDFIGMRSVLTPEQLKHLPELKPGRGLAQRGDSPGGRDFGPPGGVDGTESIKKGLSDKLR